MARHGLNYGSNVLMAWEDVRGCRNPTEPGTGQEKPSLAATFDPTMSVDSLNTSIYCPRQAFDPPYLY